MSRVVAVSDERLARVEVKITHLDQSVAEIHQGVKNIQSENNRVAIDIALLCKDVTEALKLVSRAVSDNKELNTKVNNIEKLTLEMHNDLRDELLSKHVELKLEVVKIATVISIVGAVIVFFRVPILKMFFG